MNNEIFIKLIEKYSLNKEDADYIWKIINPIFSHNEFQRRMTGEFAHHSNITLGEHLLEDTIVTYILSNKYIGKKQINIPLALKISMLHDLYTLPWQNNELSKVKRFSNKHGFRHPIEAVINSINWFPEIFINEKDSRIIIDGIIHHMFPLPVRSLKNNDITKLELKNEVLYSNISSMNKEIIINSLNKKRIGKFSLSRSKYIEGRIMSKADKKVSRKQIKNIASAKALITGKNKRLKNMHK